MQVARWRDRNGPAVHLLPSELVLVTRMLTAPCYTQHMVASLAYKEELIPRGQVMLGSSPHRPRSPIMTTEHRYRRPRHGQGARSVWPLPGAPSGYGASPGRSELGLRGYGEPLRSAGRHCPKVEEGRESSPTGTFIVASLRGALLLPVNARSLDPIAIEQPVQYGLSDAIFLSVWILRSSLITRVGPGTTVPGNYKSSAPT